MLQKIQFYGREQKKSTIKQLRKSVREDIIMNGGCPT